VKISNSSNDLSVIHAGLRPAIEDPVLQGDSGVCLDRPRSVSVDQRARLRPPQEQKEKQLGLRRPILPGLKRSSPPANSGKILRPDARRLFTEIDSFITGLLVLLDALSLPKVHTRRPEDVAFTILDHDVCVSMQLVHPQNRGVWGCSCRNVTEAQHFQGGLIQHAHGLASVGQRKRDKRPTD